MRRTLVTFVASTLACLALTSAHAVGRMVDVQVVDRGTGETLTPIFHDGAWWIAGRPGARYGVTLLSRQPQRTLNVVSIDGVNAISGDTAAWSQTGYVLGAYQRTAIDGWRKNMNQVAAFEFTALPDSYAARTGRPANVGVIGVAIFDEWPRPIARPAPATAAPEQARRLDAAPASQAATDAATETASPARPDRDKAGNALMDRDRLGTGHGTIEESAIRYVDFKRARSTPDEIVTLHYDRLENLIAMGIVPAPTVAPIAANPFPDSGRFVADPPPRR